MERCYKAMCDIISHHYFEIDAKVIFEVCKNKIPKLGETIKSLRYVRNKKPPWNSQNYMNMALSYLYSFYLKFIGFCNLFKTFLSKITYISPQYPFPIFRRPNQMIHSIIYSMTISLYCHACNLKYETTF